MISLVGGGVCWYLINHNYDILIKTSLLNAPQIVDSMARELTLTNQLLISVFSGLIVFLVFAGLKLTHSIISPILIIQSHMRELARGNLQGARVTLRKTDEFLDFADSYNYLVASLEAQTAQDIRKLQTLQPDERNLDALMVWQKMLDEKQEQIGISNTESAISDGITSASTDPAPVSRHAS
jgi:signal transduction histidine kinase